MTGALPAGRWSLRLAEPDLLSWCIVGAYAVAFVLAVAAVVVTRSGRRRVRGLDAAEERAQVVLGRVWFVVALVLLALGTTKLLDVQGWFVAKMRGASVEGGWYGRRREYQAEVIAGLFVLGVLVTGLLAYLLRRVFWRVALVIVTVAMLVVFVAVRAISFHYVDSLLELGGRSGVDPMLKVGSMVLVVAAPLQWHWAQRRIVDRAVASATPGTSLVPPMPLPPPVPTRR